MTTTARKPMTLDDHGMLPTNGWSKPLDDAYGVELDGIRTALGQLIDAYKRKSRDIERDERLTANGKTDALMALRKQTKVEIDAVANPMFKRLNEAKENLTRLLPKTVPLPTGLTEASKFWDDLREIRNVLKGMKNADRITQLRAAAKRGDAHTLLAVQTAPDVLRVGPSALVDEEEFDAFVALYVKEANPDAFAKIDLNESARGFLKTNVQRAYGVIRYTMTPDEIKPAETQAMDAKAVARNTGTMILDNDG